MSSAEFQLFNHGREVAQDVHYGKIKLLFLYVFYKVVKETGHKGVINFSSVMKCPKLKQTDYF